MLNLDPAERRALCARAHHLQPVVSIGQHGLTPAVLHEIDVNLLAHELIKLRVFSGERASRDDLLARVCAELGAAPVQHLGKVLVIYRPRPDEETEAPAPVRRAARPSKPAPADRKRPAGSAPATPGSDRARTPGGRGAATHEPTVPRAQPAPSGPGRRGAKSPARKRPPSPPTGEPGAIGKRAPRSTPTAHGKARPPSGKTSTRTRAQGAGGPVQSPAPRQRRSAGPGKGAQAAPTPAAARSRRRRG
ncbi:MAG: YhbY family RNA-binding protein [Casimicrobiaceae bacterium]